VTLAHWPLLEQERLERFVARAEWILGLAMIAVLIVLQTGFGAMTVFAFFFLGFSLRALSDDRSRQSTVTVAVLFGLIGCAFFFVLATMRLNNFWKDRQISWPSALDLAIASEATWIQLRVLWSAARHSRECKFDDHSKALDEFKHLND
jgi:hypothetical protein